MEKFTARHSLPMALEEVTPEWLTDALSEYAPGTRVISVDASEPIHGTSTNAQLTLEYAPHRSGVLPLPATMWLKAGFEEHSAQTAMYGTYESEALFYQRLASILPFRTPTCYYAGTDPDSRQGIVLLEDLAARQVTFGKATEPVDADTAALVLDGLARLHAATWGGAPYGELPFVRKGISYEEDGAHYFKAQTPEVVAEWIGRRSGVVPVPAAVNNPERIVRAFWRLAELSSLPPLCLIHSDAHIDNIYFDTGVPGFLDFQALYVSSWAWDASYFMVKSMTVEERRRSEVDLLKYYLDRLSRHGVSSPPSFDAAWLAYRQYNAYALLTSIVNPDSFKPAEINIAWTSRAVNAADDLDTLGALGV
ncbi:phosphotransferase [Frankia sp. Cppng1_Ct_nod]|uniref:phosphotransferase n=1 Tax=Frankia sp. Cppng1_Ct_nod TaxID=2897162 RepID=UPI001040E7B7|nr:phosphotransferase [Frankia sp. Cppng1_Ct_nod]